VTEPELWPRVEQLYHAALARDERDRSTFLRLVCGDDEALRREVESLLAYAKDAQGFLSAPALEAIAPAYAEEPRGLLAGQRLGVYEIAAPIGAGGMGEVYRGRDTRLGRTVAIKVLPRVFTADADRRARFEREARLLASLSHPHIGAIYGLESHDGIDALVLEFLEGQTLAELQRKGPLQLLRVLAVARQIADALEAAHDKGIVHRDLKPANIGFTRDGIVKVLDFGLAKARVDESAPDLTRSPTVTIGATHEGVILGTAAYMSPEQARGLAVDKRSDIWAFGCVVFEMLTGRQVFGATTVSDTIVRILDREPEWQRLPDATPSSVRRLLRRCLEKDPARRLHDIADARIEIDDAREPDEVSSDASRHATASRWLQAAAAAGVIAIVALALTLWRGAPEGAMDVARLTVSLPQSHVLEKSRFAPVALSPDGRLLAYVASMSGGRTQLFLRPLDSLTARPVQATGGASTPFFSPDGRWLGFYADGGLMKVSVAGGAPLAISAVPPVWSAAWGDDESIVFATTNDSGLWRVAATGGEAVQLTMPAADESQHGYPQFLPSGSVLFSVRRGETWHLAMVAAAGGQPRTLGNGRAVGEAAQYLAGGHLVYAQSGGLVATPFDPSQGTLDQPAVPLLEQVESSRFGGAYFAIAPKAGTLAYVPAALDVGSRSLLRVDRDGRSTPLIETRAAYESPSFSPDGRRLAVTIASEHGSDVWIVDLARSTRIRLTAGGRSAWPVWSHDGARVAFQSAAPGPWNLFWKPVDGSADAQPLLATRVSASAAWPAAVAGLLPGTLPTLSGAGPQFPSSWLPDGNALAFHERKPNGERDIWTVTPGDEPMPFLLTPFDERSPRFSPDGRWLAYVSDESGRDDVYVQPFPGPGAKWLISTDGGVDPVWSRDGRELFYRAGDRLMAAPVESEGDLSAGPARPLFEIRVDAADSGPAYDVSPDGRSFVVPRSETAPPRGELHVVLNWFEEVARRAAP
jgi:eukaryotic-like serine/threonine-protein kinase